MTRWLTSMMVLAGLLAFGTARAQQVVEVEGQKFEPTVTVGGQALNLNGVGLRKRAIFKVYVAGLYAGQKSTSAGAWWSKVNRCRCDHTCSRNCCIACASCSWAASASKSS